MASISHGPVRKRPSRLPSLLPKMARLLHVFSSNGDPFEKDRNYNPFDAFKLLFHDGNAEAARADLLKQGYGRLRIPLLTCRELDGNDYQQTYLIPGVYVPKQPCLVGGPRKGMKTSILIALAIALAACLRFLGHFVVTRPVKVIILSGESGMATLQETARRIAKSMGLLLSEIENLFWSDFLPRLDDAQHLDALERMIEETGCEVLIVDPAYLCLPGGDAGNIFIQGSLLRSINEICQRHGVGLVLAHHFRKRAKAKSAADFDPPELDDLSWSGFAELRGNGFCWGEGNHTSRAAASIVYGCRSADRQATPRFGGLILTKVSRASHDTGMSSF